MGELHLGTHQEIPLSTLTDILPPWPQEQRERLRVDIAAHGLQEPIAVWRGQIIDGRHLYEVCTGLGVEPEYLFLDDGADPLAFVISKNAIRRHPDESQRAVAAFHLAAEFASLPPVKDPQAGEIFPRRLTQREAAQLMGVSDRLVKHAARRSGRERQDAQPGQGVAELGLPSPAPGKMQGQAAGQGEEPPP